MVSRAFVVFGIGVLTVALVVLIQFASTNHSTLTQTLQTSQDAKAAAKAAADSAQRIKDCTEPTGGCYQRGQKATGEAVANINRITVFAVACAQDPSVPDTYPAIAACVARLIRENP